jgi:hypothetical protein
LGALEFSVNVKLARLLRDELGLEVFVETGTFEGAAIRRVRPLFDEIHSIELSQIYFERASVQFGGDSAIRLYHGDSATTLADLRPALADRAVLYWLDAHWCVAESTAGEQSQCALLPELSALRPLNARSAVLIDDARLFLSPPPRPHEAAQWPSFQEVLESLTALSDQHEMMVLNDVIVYFPRSVRTAVMGHARRAGVDVLAAVSQTAALEQELTTLRSAAEERLAAIHELTRVAEERLAVIAELTDALAKARAEAS